MATAISERAKYAMKGNNYLIASLMMEFNRSQNTIENWIAGKDVRLTTPGAIRIIMKYTALREDEILENAEMETVSK